MVEPLARTPPPLTSTAWMKPLPPATRLLFFADRTARAAAAAAFPMPPTDDACRAHVEGSRACLWLGPDEYLLLAPVDQAATQVKAALAAAMGSAPHALVDVSHRQVGFEIHGALAAPILNGACALDLDLGEFPIGMCTRTALAKADMVLWRTQTDTFRVEVWRSFTPYVTALLTEIAGALPAAS